MTKAERVFVTTFVSSSSGVLFGLVAGLVRMGQLSKEINLSLAAGDPIVWLCVAAIGLGICLSTRVKSTDDDKKSNESEDNRPKRHIIEKHNFEVTPLSINLGETVNSAIPVVPTEKPKAGVAVEDSGPDLMDVVMNQAMYGTHVVITRFSQPKKK